MSDAPEILTSERVPEFAQVKPREVVALINQKGGNGKTTTAVTVGAYLASQGVSVDLIDADPQDGSATGWLPPRWDDVPTEQQWDLSHVLLDETDLNSAIWPVNVDGPLRLAPSFKSLKQFELQSIPGKDTALQDALEDADREAGVTLIDCPPNMDQITVSALVAASAVVIPVRIGGLDFKGVGELNYTLRRVRRRLRKDQRTVAVLTTARQRSSLTDQVTEQLLVDYPDAFHAGIRHTVRVGEAPFAGEPLTSYAPDCTAMEDYKDFTEALFAQVLAEARS